MDAFDHFIKETLREPFYIRYTDDALVVRSDNNHLALILPSIREWLSNERRLELHPCKLEIRKLRQGIDFLGFVTLPHYRALRTKTKRRMLARVDAANIQSYLGLLKHCKANGLKKRIQYICRLMIIMLSKSAPPID